MDASFLMLCAEKGRDFIELAEEALGERLECHVLDDVVAELRALASRRGGRGAMARAALEIAEKKMRILKSCSSAAETDDRLLEESERGGFVIATVDKELIDKARGRGLAILTVTADQRILFTGTLL